MDCSPPGSSVHEELLLPRQEYWSRLPFPSLADLDRGIKGLNPHLHWQADFFFFSFFIYHWATRKLEKEMATHSSTLAWKIPWTRSLVGYSPRGRKDLDTTERLYFTSLHQEMGQRGLILGKKLCVQVSGRPERCWMIVGRSIVIGEAGREGGV